ncbi:MAG TPA: HD domain-containing phosphohydrolase [Dissulfurispiraceae bacterium]|nr:HD domain-containing phosphohydrolase [Dissulfurispiraceae bacterium]
MAEYEKVRKRTYVIDHTPIKMDYLVVGTHLPFDVYTREKSVYKLTFEKGHTYNHIDRNNLKNRGISEVYVDEEVMDEVNKYKKKNADANPATLSPEKKFEKYTLDKDRCYYVGRKLLLPGERINFSLLVIRNMEMHELLAADESNTSEISVGHIDYDQTIGDIVIKRSDIKHYHNYINNLVKSERQLLGEKILIKNWAAIENLKIMLDFLLNSPSNKDVIMRIRAATIPLVNVVSENINSIPDLLTKGLHNYFYNVHSVNVAILATGLALKIGIKQKEAQTVTLGALLHDVGISIIPSAIINKMGNLSDSEFQIYKNHVMEGERLLGTDKSLPEDVVLAASQHHEKLSRRGYPLKPSADRIKLYSRITAICDSYDALTTKKPFRDSLSPLEAMALLSKESENYDPALIKMFVSMMGGTSKQA